MCNNVCLVFTDFFLFLLQASNGFLHEGHVTQLFCFLNKVQPGSLAKLYKEKVTAREGLAPWAKH